MEEKPYEPVYTESYFITGETNEDLRNSNLDIINGEKISLTTPDGIIVSEVIFNKLADTNKIINRGTYRNQTFSLDVKLGNEQIQSFPCRIVGIAKETPYNGSLVYVAFPLAVQIDNWVNPRADGSSNYKERKYKRFDFVTNLQGF